MRVVIDTNVLRLTIKKGNFERFIYDAFKAEIFEWIVSTEILEEYEEKLIEFYSVPARPKLRFGAGDGFASLTHSSIQSVRDAKPLPAPNRSLGRASEDW
jgi:hypothetical protein